MPSICLVTALPAESAPCLQHFRLRRDPTRDRIVYRGERCLLLETGRGKLSAAASLSALLATERDVRAVIHVGVARGRVAESPPDAGDALPSVVLAHEIVDAGSGRRWYPQLPPVSRFPGLATVSLHTVERADSVPFDAIGDGEAAGIYTAALMQLDLARVQCVKAVIDSPTPAVEALDRDRMEWASRHSLDVVDALIDYLDGLARFSGLAHATIGDSLDHWCRDRQGSTTERHRLRRNLQRYLAMTGRLPERDDLPDPRGLGELNAALEARLALLPHRY